MPTPITAQTVHSTYILHLGVISNQWHHLPQIVHHNKMSYLCTTQFLPMRPSFETNVIWYWSSFQQCLLLHVIMSGHTITAWLKAHGLIEFNSKKPYIYY